MEHPQPPGGGRSNDMAHWTGTRSGWNTKGGTDADHLAIQRQMADEAKARALRTCGRLADMLGDDEYVAWVDANVTDWMPWPEIDRLAEARIAEGLR
jgi:hypothetical protein